MVFGNLEKDIVKETLAVFTLYLVVRLGPS